MHKLAVMLGRSALVVTGERIDESAGRQVEIVARNYTAQVRK